MTTCNKNIPEQEQTQLPACFTLLATPLALLGPQDGRYIARVFAQDCQSEGILIYEDDHEILFSTADEAVVEAMYILREAWPLLAVCDPTISLNHADAMEYLRSHRELQ